METIAERATLRPGEMLNWYRIIRVLGRGGFGVTYLAQDINLQMDVAIKEYLPDAIASRGSDNSVNPNTTGDHKIFKWGLKSFLKEARTLVKFKHTNIVRVMAVFESNGTAYMVMEYEHGQDLKELLNKTNSMEEAELKNLILPIIDGLGEVHKHDFIHRDIKPANIYVREDNSPVLLDFGSARQALSGVTQQLTALVSVGYTPLEQYGDSADSQQGPWTDIYSLGAVLYFTISGKAPVDSTLRASALFNNRPDPLCPIAEIGRDRYNADFLSAIDWALEFKVSNRPKSLEAWRDRLDEDSTVQLTTEIISGDTEIDRSGQSILHPETVFDPDDWEPPVQQHSVRPTIDSYSRPTGRSTGRATGRATGRNSGRTIGRSARRSKKWLWPVLTLLIGLPLVLFAYMKVVYPEKTAGFMRPDSELNAKQSRELEAARQAELAANQKREQEEAARQAELEVNHKEQEAARQIELAANQKREQEAARQAELEANRKSEKEEAARQAELAATQRREQEAERQAELEANQKREKEEAARQAELEANRKREREAALQAELEAKRGTRARGRAPGFAEGKTGTRAGNRE